MTVKVGQEIDTGPFLGTVVLVHAGEDHEQVTVVHDPYRRKFAIKTVVVLAHDPHREEYVVWTVTSTEIEGDARIRIEPGDALYTRDWDQGLQWYLGRIARRACQHRDKTAPDPIRALFSGKEG